MKKLPYSEGSVFLVPLRTSGYARGVVARASPHGRVLFGYFFGPRLGSAQAANLADLVPSTAILKLRFGDLGLINGEWPVEGMLHGWDRSEWPMPDFARRAPGMKTRIVTYSDDNPMCVEAERATDEEVDLPTDLLSGYGAVEIKLTKLLD